ncbi:MAG: SpoIIE family protein phosphatase [Solirubrobacteraceae bacterium]
MARDTGKHPTPTRRTARLAAVLVVCCALSLAFISSAIARRDHSKPPAAQPAPPEASVAPAAGQTPAASAPAETSAAPAGGQTSAPTGTISPRRTHHRDNPGSTHGSAHTPSTGAAAQPASTGQPSSAGQEAGQEAAGTPVPANPQLEAGAQARRKKEGTKPKRPREPGRKGKGRSGKGGGTSGEGEGGSASGNEGEAAGTSTPTTPTIATPTAATPIASAPEPTASAATASPPATPTPSPASGTSTPAAGGRYARVPRRAVRARRHASAPPRTGVAAFAAAGAVPAAARSVPTAPASGPRRAPTSSHAAAPHGRPSPLVTTITKIVDVVPVAVRALIGALLALALALAARSRVSALRARRLDRQRVQLLEDVGLLQAALLPVPPARLGPVGTSAAYQPAAGPGAGGDFYDVFALQDGKLAVIVGDVSGHGRQALPHTALVRFTLRAYLEAGLSPRDAVQTAGAVLERQLGGVFATVVAATYQPRERVLVYACAGHPPPVVLGTAAGAATDAQAVAPVTVSASPPIGVGMRTGTRQTVVSVPGRSQICFYTDGLTEARVGSELFGTERLVDTLAELGAAATASAVLARVAERADARPDDMAACLLSVEGDDQAPAVLVEELELSRDEAAGDRTARFLLACGVERHGVAEVMRAARVAAGRAGTVVLEVRHTHGPPQVTFQREQVSYLHARRADVGVAL